MFCPKCGAESLNAKFCRACGTNLEPVMGALGEPLAGRPVGVQRGGGSTLAIFNSQELSNAGRDLNGHSAVAVFGTVAIDLRSDLLPEGETHLSIVSIFGTVDLFVPDDAAVWISGLGIFGNVSVSGGNLGNGFVSTMDEKPPGYDEAPVRLHLDVVTIFGMTQLKE